LPPSIPSMQQAAAADMDVGSTVAVLDDVIRRTDADEDSFARFSNDFGSLEHQHAREPSSAAVSPSSAVLPVTSLLQLPDPAQPAPTGELLTPSAIIPARPVLPEADVSAVSPVEAMNQPASGEAHQQHGDGAAVDNAVYPATSPVSRQHTIASEMHRAIDRLEAVGERQQLMLGLESARSLGKEIAGALAEKVVAATTNAKDRRRRRPVKRLAEHDMGGSAHFADQEHSNNREPSGHLQSAHQLWHPPANRLPISHYLDASPLDVSCQGTASDGELFARHGDVSSDGEIGRSVPMSDGELLLSDGEV